MANYLVRISVDYSTVIEAASLEDAIKKAPDPPPPAKDWQQVEVSEYEIQREGSGG
jgi:hypothetical protein